MTKYSRRQNRLVLTAISILIVGVWLWLQSGGPAR